MYSCVATSPVVSAVNVLEVHTVEVVNIVEVAESIQLLL